MRTAYFPTEIPPIITTRFFADYCKKEFSTLEKQSESLLKLSTRYDTFTAPRSDSGRRHLALVHPLGQLAISLVITKNRVKLTSALSRSKSSLYGVAQAPSLSRAFSGLDFDEWRHRKFELCAAYPFLLRADISRFFYTIYTHSIPWAVLGKEKAKDWYFNHRKRLNAHWSSYLDRALQCC